MKKGPDKFGSTRLEEGTVKMEKKKNVEEGDDRAVWEPTNTTADTSAIKLSSSGFILALMLPGTVEAV